MHKTIRITKEKIDPILKIMKPICCICWRENVIIGFLSPFIYNAAFHILIPQIFLRSLVRFSKKYIQRFVNAVQSEEEKFIGRFSTRFHKIPV